MSSDRIQVVQGDITKLQVDAIVNAANESLEGGGGVDGAIHKAAGPKLLEECKEIGGCPTGEARITGGYDLPAGHVIHAVGPRYKDGKSGEPELLRSCYVESLTLAGHHGLDSIAFPSISTGAYGFPKDEACAIALDTVRFWLRVHEHPKQVTFCCFDQEDYERYRKELEQGEVGLA